MRQPTKSHFSFWCALIILCSLTVFIPKITRAVPLLPADTVMVVTKMWPAHASSVEKSHHDFDFEKNMPWITALSIGVITVLANLYVGYRSRVSNLKMLKDQMGSTQAIALAQIEQSQKNSEREFNKTVISGARQVWINNLRDSISNILALNSKFVMYQIISDDDANGLWLQIAKVELMLIASEYGKLLGIVKELEHCCKQIQTGNQSYECIEEILPALKEETSLALTQEWQKTRNGF